MRVVLAAAVAALALAMPSGSSEHSYSMDGQQLWRAFVCIHSYEAPWNADTGNGYFGGLQMNPRFERDYGAEFLSMWGNANRWPSAVQITVAMRAYESQGFAPWPNTARLCGLD